MSTKLGKKWKGIGKGPHRAFGRACAIEGPVALIFMVSLPLMSMTNSVRMSTPEGQGLFFFIDV